MSPTTRWTLRSARAADAPLIAAHRLFRAGEDPADIAVYAAWVGPRIESGSYLGRLAEVGGAVVGGAGAVLLDWGPVRGSPCALRARIVNVFVDPQQRRRGMAIALLHQVLADCRAIGVQDFCLSSTPDAEALYARLGFVASGAERVLRGATL